MAEKGSGSSVMKHVWAGVAFALAFSIVGFFYFEVSQKRAHLEWETTQEIQFKKWAITRQGMRSPRLSLRPVGEINREEDRGL